MRKGFWLPKTIVNLEFIVCELTAIQKSFGKQIMHLEDKENQYARNHDSNTPFYRLLSLGYVEFSARIMMIRFIDG